MKTPLPLLLVIPLLAVGGIALAQTGGPGPGQAMSVQAGTSSGGSYHLTSLALRQAPDDAWQVSGTARGGGYALSIPKAPALRGSGCCCTYLPCALRNW